MRDFSNEEAQAIHYGSATSLPLQAKRPMVESESPAIHILNPLLMGLFQPARGHTTTSEHILLCNFPQRLSSKWSDRSSIVWTALSMLVGIFMGGGLLPSFVCTPVIAYNVKINKSF